MVVTLQENNNNLSRKIIIIITRTIINFLFLHVQQYYNQQKIQTIVIISCHRKLAMS